MAYGKPGNEFQTTSWSLVQAAATQDSVRSRQALTVLCEAYWQPVYAFVRRQGYGAEAARDLTQAFFAHLLEAHALENLVPGAGRFRSFLMTSVKNLMRDEVRRKRALKRGAAQPPLSLDFELAENNYRVQPTDPATPEHLFEQRWASTVVKRVLNRMEQQAEDDGKSWEFGRLKVFLTGEKPAKSYRETARELEMTEDAARMAVRRLRQRFGDELREEIATTVANRDDVDDEIRHLLSVLRG